MERHREVEALDAYSTLVNEAAERVGPAVVKIQTQVTRRGPRGQNQGQGQGSGVIFARAGQILTNAHVVDGAEKIVVTLADGRIFEGGVLGRDRSHDIAAVKIGARDLPVAELSERPLKIGQLVVAIGNPLGLGWSVTAGVVSAVGRTLQAPGGVNLENLIQTDTPINPGSSGGPLVDTHGRVVGITTAMVQFAQGLGFAVPTATALTSLGRFLAPKEARGDAPELGVGGTLTHIDDWIVSKNRLGQREGILVLEVKPSSPAEKASLRLLDIITDVDGGTVRTPAELAKRVSAHRKGEPLAIGFLRDGTKRRVTAVLDGHED